MSNKASVNAKTTNSTKLPKVKVTTTGAPIMKPSTIAKEPVTAVKSKRNIASDKKTEGTKPSSLPPIDTSPSKEAAAVEVSPVSVSPIDAAEITDQLSMTAAAAEKAAEAEKAAKLLLENAGKEKMEAEMKRISGNGGITIVYEQYHELFPIVDGCLTDKDIDEVYCLTFVMPNCLIHLSIHSPADKRRIEADGYVDDIYVYEEPRGSYHNLCKNSTYYCYVEQEQEQLLRDQERMKRIIADMTFSSTVAISSKKDDGRVIESCSCIYGNPCVDEYGCKDWSNRMTVALKNGWKGF